MEIGRINCFLAIASGQFSFSIQHLVKTAKSSHLKISPIVLEVIRPTRCPH